MRIKTAYGPGLDVVSNDYFGTSLPRLPNESDASFRARILAALLQPRVTRAAIANAIQQLTGIAPRMIEPWNPMDTAAWGEKSFWGLDDVTIPFLWGNPGLRYQGFIELAIPLFNITGGQPVYGFDDAVSGSAGWAWGVPQCAWFDSIVEENPVIGAQVNQTIAAFKALGTMVWERVVPPPFMQTSGSIQIAMGSASGANAPASPLLYDIAGSKPAIFIENPPWPVPYWLNDYTRPFTVQIPLQAPAPATLGWLALSYLASNVLHVEVTPGASNITIPIPAGAPLNPIVMMGWNSTCWASMGSGTITLNFGVASPGGHLELAFMPDAMSGSVAPSAGSNGIEVALPSVGSYAAFALPSWNTSVGISQKFNNGMSLAWNVPAPAGAKIWYSRQQGVV